jgi:desulfoferrodoxin-like iron-binding protein
MEALDGNAIAGTLFEHFGTEMTTTIGACAHCGTRAQVAELVVYMRAPGTVVRCRHCGNVVMVLVPIRGQLRVDSSAFRMEQASGES